MKTNKKLKTLKSTDNVSITFGEWFDRTYGNTYYDADIYINDLHVQLPYQYGYNHGDKQAIDEALADIGYRVRTNKSNPHAPYSHIRTSCCDKKKRELFK